MRAATTTCATKQLQTDIPRVRDGSTNDTTGRGDITEIHVAAALMRTGRRVLRPISNGLRYDLLIDNGDGTFWRVQCKTGLLKDGYIVFRARNFDARRPNGVSYRGQIESFGVFCPEIGRTFGADEGADRVRFNGQIATATGEERSADRRTSSRRVRDLGRRHRRRPLLPADQQDRRREPVQEVLPGHGAELPRREEARDRHIAERAPHGVDVVIGLTEER